MPIRPIVKFGVRDGDVLSSGTAMGGELTVVGKSGNRPEVVDFLKRFIATDVQCKMGSVTASSRISPNVDVGADCYANDILAGASVVLTDALKAGTGRFDASDLMPPVVGAGAFWTEMVSWINNNGADTEAMLQRIDDNWP